MRVFGNPGSGRGCFMAVHVDAEATRGAVLRLPAGVALPTSWQDPYMITGVTLTGSEAMSHSASFGDNVCSYALGNDPRAGKGAVTFMALINADGGNTVPKLIDAYRANRASVALKEAQVFVAGNLWFKGFISGINLGTADTDIDVQSVTFQLDVVRI